MLSSTKVSIDDFSATIQYPEVILPSQYFDRTRRELAPTKRLLLALLKDCLECATNRSRSRRAIRLRREAQHWLFASKVNAPVTLEHVCDSLNLDPEYLRAGVARWLRNARSAESAERGNKAA